MKQQCLLVVVVNEAEAGCNYLRIVQGAGCGGDFFHTGGSFTSPFYPGNYSRDSDCRWKVRVPAGLKVVIKITGK